MKQDSQTLVPSLRSRRGLKNFGWVYSILAMRVLISGAGIAGPTLAYWLAHYGLKPTIVEKAPKLRTGGYIIDFWGLAFNVADRMELLPEIRRKGYMVREVRIVDRTGKRIAGFPAKAVARIAQGRFVSLARGDLAVTIFDAIEGKVESIFDDSVARIEQTAESVRVAFESGTVRDFDLVIGADGLHSRVRGLVFGSQSQFEKYLGYKVAAFEVQGYRPRDELVYVMYTEVGQQVGRFAMRGDRSMFMFIFADQELDGTAIGDVQGQKALLRKRFGNSGWECPQILDALDATNDFYFDRISQVQMGAAAGSWTRGRVSLVGDAAFCVSLLAGQGSALAIVAAYILAGELHRAGSDYAAALARYQERLDSFVFKKQKAALRFAGTFAPKSKLSMYMRNQIMNMLRIPLVADLAAGRDLTDILALPEY
jgi:2-polyprenyl-6-methoxyphenol hydroxylase-like FAD-dependent oxidoreductase